MLLLGLTMTTRSEIGLLIAAVSQTTWLPAPKEGYLVVVWGILLCTIIGPIGVGIIFGSVEEVTAVAGSQKTFFEDAGGLYSACL